MHTPATSEFSDAHVNEAHGRRQTFLRASRFRYPRGTRAGALLVVATFTGFGWWLDSGHDHTIEPVPPSAILEPESKCDELRVHQATDSSKCLAQVLGSPQATGLCS